MVVLKPLRASAFVVLALLIAFSVSWAAKVDDFTFVQVTDIHTTSMDSSATFAELEKLGAVSMQPYHVTAKAPEFIIATGDLTEFGTSAAWQKNLENYKNIKIPVYLVAGNHDNCWNSIRYDLRNSGRKPFYSFDAHGCHFIGLESVTVQDPRPNFSEEELDFVKADLARVSPETPVFLFFHHPLDSDEFASNYDKDRLLELLRGHNIALILVGHGHSVRRADYGGINSVMGGCAFGKNAGYNVVSVQDGVLRVAFKRVGEQAAAKPLIEKYIDLNRYPAITLQADADNLASPRVLKLRSWAGRLALRSAKETFEIDGAIKGELSKGSDGFFTADVDISTLAPGTHNVKVVAAVDGAKYQKAAEFSIEGGTAKSLWRVQLGGGSKSTPTVSGGTVYVGANDGKLYALDARTGEKRWSYRAGGEVTSQPLVAGGTVYFGSGDGHLYALITGGKLRWSFEAGGAVYSSPVMAGDLVIFGCNNTSLYAVNAKTGKLAWKFDDPEYAIESKPFVVGDTVYFGAWDSFIYAVNLKDGKLKWRCETLGARDQVNNKRYYSAGDCGPVVSNGVMVIADRNYKVSLLNAENGEIIKFMDKCAGVGLSGDGEFAYLHRTDGNLTKIDLTVKEIWSAPAGLGYVPTAPVESDGVVYVATGVGLVSAYRAADGKKLWEYQATPKLYVYSNVSASKGVAYVSGIDGSLTAITSK